MATVADWAALSGPIIGVVAAVGKALARKLDKVGEHLAKQDRRGRLTERRMIRVETKLGLDPLPPSPTDDD